MVTTAVVEVLLKAGADHETDTFQAQTHSNLIPKMKSKINARYSITSQKTGADHSFFSFLSIIIIQVHLCHYRMVTHLYTKHQLMVTRLLLRCY